eukprot:4027953-Pyramimonas_sp.AAC.1
MRGALSISYESRILGIPEAILCWSVACPRTYTAYPKASPRMSFLRVARRATDLCVFDLCE